MALIGEPHGTGDLADGEIRFGQHSFCALDPCPQNVLARRDTKALAELPVEVEATDPGNAREIIEAGNKARNGSPPATMSKAARAIINAGRKALGEID